MTSLHLDPTRAQLCAEEPLQYIGSIQPMGFLVGLRLADDVIALCSDNVASFIGFTPDQILGAQASALFDPTSLGQLRGVSNPNDPAVQVVSVRTADGSSWEYETAIHSAGAFLIIEFEPQSESQTGIHSQLTKASTRLMGQHDVDGLRQAMTEEIKLLTGFDRCMIYHFHTDGHGEVVAETAEPELTPYVGQHFPASDIPYQARRIYRVCRSRIIADVDYEPAQLIALSGTEPVDLTRSLLRGVSEFHLQFMRNMGTESSMSFSLVSAGEVDGLVSCLAIKSRWVPYSVRRACEVLTRVYEARVRSLTAAETARRALTASTAAREAADLLLQSHLAGAEAALPVLETARGFVALLRGERFAAGETPPAEQLDASVRAMIAGPVPLTQAVTQLLPRDFPALALASPDVVGCVIFPIGSDGSYIAWVAPAETITVNWMGEPQAQSEPAVPLSPRASFAAWYETVRDQSAEWDRSDIAVATSMRDRIRSSF